MRASVKVGGRKMGSEARRVKKRVEKQKEPDWSLVSLSRRKYVPDLQRLRMCLDHFSDL